MAPGTVSAATRDHLTNEDRVTLLESEMIVVMDTVERAKRLMYGFGGFCTAIAVVWSVIGTVVVLKIGEISGLAVAMARVETRLESFDKDRKINDAAIAEALRLHDARETEEIRQQKGRR